jgi:regulator of replication initiation timing
MFPSSQPIVIRLRQSVGLIDLSELRMSLEQTMLALEAEIDALQKLVCYLLEKNERLRMRCNGLESDVPAGSRPCAAHTESLGKLQTMSAE